MQHNISGSDHTLLPHNISNTSLALVLALFLLFLYPYSTLFLLFSNSSLPLLLLYSAADTATLILAVGGALIGALVIGVSICVIYCCCYRVNKYTNPATLPEIIDTHPPMAEAVIAQSSSSNPTSTRSMTGYPVALPTPVARGMVQNVYVLQDVENHDPTLPLYHTNQAAA